MEDIQTIQEESKPRKSGFRRFMTRFLLVFILLLGVLVYWKYFYTYSNGVQGGKMQKISKKGNIFKTWEGYLLISASTDPNSAILGPKEWKFSVTSDSIAKVLENYAEKNVRLRYKEKNGTLPWRGDTRYIIYEVDLIK